MELHSMAIPMENIPKLQDCSSFKDFPEKHNHRNFLNYFFGCPPGSPKEKFRRSFRAPAKVVNVDILNSFASPREDNESTWMSVGHHPSLNRRSFSVQTTDLFFFWLYSLQPKLLIKCNFMQTKRKSSQNR